MNTHPFHMTYSLSEMCTDYLSKGCLDSWYQPLERSVHTHFGGSQLRAVSRELSVYEFTKDMPVTSTQQVNLNLHGKSASPYGTYLRYGNTFL